MTNGLTFLLSASPEEAKKLAPATIELAWDDYPEERVRRYLAAAVRLSKRVNRHLDRLRGSARRQVLWDAASSLERYWFGDYSEVKLDKVHRTFQGITRHLSSSALVVICDDLKSYYGKSFPGIERIRLGHAWHYPPVTYGDDRDPERVQTFIHEASHICGRFSTAEAGSYGRPSAHRLSRWAMRATRNADNYGYYALDVADRTETLEVPVL